MPISVPVGPVTFDLDLVPGWLEFEGRKVRGLCDRDNCRISISGAAPIPLRKVTVWHEIGHAINDVLNIRPDARLDEETMCNLLGLAMGLLDERTILRVNAYMATGIDADDVMLLRGCPQPVPVLRMASRL